MENNMKKCSTCKQIKPLDQFAKRKVSYHNKHGLSYDCKICKNKATKVANAKRRDFLRDYKLNKGCEICGYNAHHAALDLDHIDPNNKNEMLKAKGGRKPSRSMSSLSMKQLEIELPKCRVLCSNCHRVHTFEERHYFNGQ